MDHNCAQKKEEGKATSGQTTSSGNAASLTAGGSIPRSSARPNGGLYSNVRRDDYVYDDTKVKDNDETSPPRREAKFE